MKIMRLFLLGIIFTITPLLAKSQGIALDFDGADDFVDIPSKAFTAYTVEFWFEAIDVSTRNLMVYTDAAGINTNASHMVVLDANSKLFAVTYDGDVKSVTGTTTIVADTWYHVAYSASNSGQLKLYVNGVEEGTPANVGTLFTGTAPRKFLLGSEHSNSGWPFFQGQIDELRIWDDERTASEIADNYRKSLTGRENNLYGLYTFNSTTGSVLTDQTTNAQNGTLTNMDNADWVTSGAGFVSDKGNTLEFDGVNEKVEVLGNTALDNVNGTVEFWVKTSNAGSSWRGLVTYYDRFTVVFLDNVITVYQVAPVAWTTAGSALNDG